MIEGARNDSRICLQILPIFRQIKNFREKILKLKKAHHKAKKNYNKYLNTKDEDKYRIVYTDKQALYESSTEEYTLQVEKFNQAQVRLTKPIISGRSSSQSRRSPLETRLQRKSVEMTIPDACRTLQNLYADNGNQWKDILGWESRDFL